MIYFFLIFRSYHPPNHIKRYANPPKDIIDTKVSREVGAVFLGVGAGRVGSEDTEAGSTGSISDGELTDVDFGSDALGSEDAGKADTMVV